MTKIIDLRPDRKLLNTEFEKYQFSSDDVLIKKEHTLETEILNVELNSSQESWLEARLFAFHNHLFKNPYDNSCWFINKSGEIWKFGDNESLKLIYMSKCICPKDAECIYNPSIGFASKNIFAVSNGGGKLEILVETNGVIKNFEFKDIEPSVILDVRFAQETSTIILALYKVEEGENKKFSRLVILFYKYNPDSKNETQVIELIKKQMLRATGVIEHVYIEENGKFCHVISQDQIEFDYDSVNPVQVKNEKTKSDSQIKIPKYYWSQDEDSLTVYVKIPEKYKSYTTKVTTSPTVISILINDIILLSGDMFQRLDSELTTWKRVDDTLEVTLTKHETGLMWNELIKDNAEGECIPNETLAAEIHSKLSHLISNEEELKVQGQPTIGFNSEQLEECDLSGAENILQRINFNEHKITHMAMLGSSNRILFTEKQLSRQVICIRYDHDGCIWILKDSNEENWNIEHINTFPGFGYVEAGKTNKKFCISSNDGLVIAIVEHTKLILLYEKPENNAKVGKQKIFDFGSVTTPILGAATINKYLIILTKNVIYQLQIYS